MTDDTRTPEEIEREIEKRRAALSSNIDALQDRFSIDTVVRQIGDQFREHGGDMGRSISEQVKANPIPLALTGIGLAWLMMGDGRTGMAGGREGGGRDLDRSRSFRHRPPVSRTGGVGVHDDGPSWLHDDFEGRPSHPDTPWPPVADDREEGSESVADRVGTGISSASSSMSDAAASAR